MEFNKSVKHKINKYNERNPFFEDYQILYVRQGMHAIKLVILHGLTTLIQS